MSFINGADGVSKTRADIEWQNVARTGATIQAMRFSKSRWCGGQGKPLVTPKRRFSSSSRLTLGYRLDGSIGPEKIESRGFGHSKAMGWKKDAIPDNLKDRKRRRRRRRRRRRGGERSGYDWSIDGRVMRGVVVLEVLGEDSTKILSWALFQIENGT